MGKIKGVFVVLLFTLSNATFAQQDSLKKPISTHLDLMSRYVWRGNDLGFSPSIQPRAAYNKHGFSLGVWGAYAINYKGYQESDLIFGYTFKKILSFTITDYYFQNDTLNTNYFDYKKNQTTHVFEIALSFKGTKKFPFSVMIATNVYGADAKKLNGNNQYSTYTELTYTFKHFNLFVGANLTSVDLNKGETGYFGNYLGFVNVGITVLRKIKLTDKYSLPFSCSLIINPQTEKIYLVAGFLF